jgi:hypothetical protein
VEVHQFGAYFFVFRLLRQKLAEILNLWFEISVVGVVFKVSLTPTHNLEGTVSQVCTLLVWNTFSLSCCYSHYYYCYQYLIIYSINTISFSCGTVLSMDRYHEITMYEWRSCSFSCLGINFGFV